MPDAPPSAALSVRGTSQAAADAHSPAAPSSTPPRIARIVALDVLRGLAILGTLATNIGIFVMASGAAGFGEAPSGLRGILSTAYGLVTDGKWIGLLTIMFGIGLEIQRQSAMRRGDTWLGTYPWRALLLIVDGLLNYIFIFEFDVLMGYGLTGLVMCVVLATDPRVQRAFMVVGLAAHLAFLAWIQFGAGSGGVPYGGDLEEFDSGGSDLVIWTESEFEAYAESQGMTPGELEAQMFGGDTFDATASYWSQVQSRLDTFFHGGRAEIPIMFVMGCGLFLIGSFLFRAGLFQPEGARLRKRIMWLAFGIGLPIDWITRIWFSEWTHAFNRYFTSACVSIGLLALVAHFYANGRQTGIVGRAISRVGRMALSCYILQNLIASILFYSWGFGLANKLAPLNLGIWADVLGLLMVSAILIVFTTVWLRFFERGPIEWVWHVSYQWLIKHTTRPIQARRARRRLAHQAAE